MNSTHTPVNNNEFTKNYEKTVAAKTNLSQNDRNKQITNKTKLFC